MTEPARKLKIGPYLLQNRLGGGGMGLVYSGVHELSGTRAAIKTVRVRDAGRISQIRREIQALARLRHPGLVRVLTHGVDEGRPWYAMELLDGRALSEVAASAPVQRSNLAQSGIRPRVDPSIEARAWGTRAWPQELLGELLGVIQNLCETLAYVHGEGVIHRDLKPSNVLVMQSGRPVLVDFGLAAHIGDTSGREVLDSETAPAGSAHYMSPEQILGEALDPRCDLYAIGCMLFEFLTGRPVFVGSLDSVVDQHLRRPPPKLRELIDGFPPALEPLIAGLLEKDRSKRIGHARDVAAVLGTCGARPASWDAPLPPVRTYLYRPPLIGRRELLDELDQLLQSLAAGRGSIAFLEGESGVGKTRLALEVAKHAEHRGVRVIASGGLDMSAGESDDVGAQSAPLEPLRPFLRYLADACVEESEVRPLLGAAGPLLAPFEPTLADVVHAPAEAGASSLPARAALNRLYESVRELFVAFATRGPLLLIIDDLQWADELTLGLIEHLGATWAGDPQAPLMILGLLRREECSPRLRACVQASWAVRYELPRLDRGELDHMVGGMLSISRAPSAFIDYLSKQSEGNPFFVAEYLRTAVAEQLLVRDPSGQWQIAQSSEPTEVMCAALPLPHSLREVVERRVEQLDPVSRRILVVAGIIGREFDLSLLQAAAAVSEEEAIDAIAELVQRQVLEPARGADFRFAHDKLRQIPIGDLPPHERQALHRRVAEVLEARQMLQSEAQLAAVGHHWAEAGVVARAATHLHQAGDLAVRVHAFDRAIAHYRRALDGHPLDAGQLAEKLADVLSLRGSFTEARPLFERALALTASEAGIVRARLRSKLGKTWEIAHAHEHALAEYDLAETELRSVVPLDVESWRRQWIHIQLSRVWVYYWCVRVGDMNRVLEDIAPEVTQHGTALERSQYFSALAQRDLRLHRYVVNDELIANLERSRAAASEANASVDLAMGGFLLGFARMFQGELEVAEGELLGSLSSARKLGDVTLEIRCIAYLALTHRRANDAPRAQKLALETLERASAAGMGEYVGLAKACLAWVQWRSGRFAEAEQLSQDALQAWANLSFPYPFEWTAALILLALSFAGDESAQGLVLARKLHAPRSARLPDPIDAALAEAIAASEHADAKRVQHGLRNAVAAALELGYI
ncbi:MAG TPA: AAA family ATPase [Polyangiales bacterium]|nr:AAA family ATPase [Polyangiales bacterium]